MNTEKSYGSLADIGSSARKIKERTQRSVSFEHAAETKKQTKQNLDSRKKNAEKLKLLQQQADILFAAKAAAEAENLVKAKEVAAAAKGAVRSKKITDNSKTYNAGKPSENKRKKSAGAAQNMQKAEKQLITTESHRNNNRLKIMFLGGVGEIGKNMTVLEYNGDIIVIDAGLSFPGEDMPGIDSVIPDFTYLEQNKSRVRGIVITHGHEDHIGAVAYVLQKMDVPIYASRLTNAILENKIREKHLTAHLHTVESGDEISLGCFKVEFVRVNHSIAGAFALSITTPVGVVFHTGDFKIDFEPIDGKMIDLPRIAEIGKRGVKLLLAESTNIERPGHTPSERSIGKKLEDVFEDNMDKRLFVATFASNIYRVQQILNLAQKYKRKVAVVGRSMINNIEAGIRIGLFDFPKELFIDIEKANKLFPKEVLILCTGAQGEPTAALSRLSSGEFNKIEIGEEDTIILSSSPIPGNESMVNRVINNLYRKGAVVVHENVHTSGHACQEEIKTIHMLLHPEFFIPVHGEYRHLKMHANLAQDLGMDPFNIVIPEIGNVVELSEKSLLKTGNVQAGELLVDGLGIGDPDSDVLRDRKALSEDGLVIVVVSLSKDTGEPLADPYMITRGFVYSAEAERLVEEAKKILAVTLDGVDFSAQPDFADLRAIIRRPLRNFFFKETGRNPMILPIIFRA